MAYLYIILYQNFSTIQNYIHPISVAKIVVKIIKLQENSLSKLLSSNKENLIIAALLHNILEDTVYRSKALRATFGIDVLKLVKAVTKIDYNSRSSMLSNEQAFEKLINQDPFVVCIKLADRLHNLYTIDGHPKVDKRIAVAKETITFFIKAAKKYEMQEFVREMNSACNYIIENGKIDGFAFNHKFI